MGRWITFLVKYVGLLIMQLILTFVVSFMDNLNIARTGDKNELRSMHDAKGWWCWRKRLNISPLYDKFEIGILRQTKLGAEVERQYFTIFYRKMALFKYFIDISAYFAATEFQFESSVTNLQKEENLKGPNDIR